MNDLDIIDNSIIGLEIGSTKICASLCTIDEDSQIHIVGVGTSISEGIENGKIVNSDLLKNAIRRAISRAERIAKLSSKRVIVAYACRNYLLKESSSSLDIPPEQQSVRLDDKIRVIREAAGKVETNGYETIHTFPKQIFIDEEQSVADPVARTASSLKIDILTIQYEKDELTALHRICDELNLMLVAVIASPLATSKIAISPEDTSNTVSMVDIGGASTQIVVLQNSRIKHFAILPIGGNNITSDIKIVLNTSPGEAERLKISYTVLNKTTYSDQANIEYVLIENGEEKKNLTDEDLLNQIVRARVDELLKKIRKEIKPYVANPNSVTVITGGTSGMPGIDGLALVCFKNKIRMGIPQDKMEIIESKNYATSIGLIVYAIRNKIIEPQRISVSSTKRIGGFIKRWFKDFF